MNVYTWTLGASHTPAAFLAVAGQAIAYDVTDTVASFCFGLAFAPELARVLGRMRVRMDVTWEQAPAAQLAPAGPEPGGGKGRQLGAAFSLIAVLLAATLLLGGPRASGAPVSRELAFLAGAQNADGGFGAARGQTSSELYSAWTAIGLAAAGRDPLAVRRNGHSVLDSLRREAGSLQGAGDLERTILALHACGVSVHSLPGGDPVSRLMRFRDSDGSFGHLSNLTAFAVFALRAAGYSASNGAVRAAGGWLRRQQNRDGGFGFGPRGGSSDVDDTAAVLQALTDAGVHGGTVIARATSFLVHAQSLDGGYPQQKGGESNAQSTAWAAQALVAAGRDPRRVTRGGSRSPISYLLSLLSPNGSVRYSRTGAQTPVWVTAQALTALAGKPLPIAPVRLHAAVALRAAPAGASAGVASRRARSGSPLRRSHARPAPRVPAQTARRLDTLAHAVGTLLGGVLAPVLPQPRSPQL
jgi:prenyltransferase beta subunit